MRGCLVRTHISLEIPQSTKILHQALLELPILHRQTRNPGQKLGLQNMQSMVALLHRRHHPQRRPTQLLQCTWNDHMELMKSENGWRSPKPEPAKMNAQHPPKGAKPTVLFSDLSNDTGRHLSTSVSTCRDREAEATLLPHEAQSLLQPCTQEHIEIQKNRFSD